MRPAPIDTLQFEVATLRVNPDGAALRCVKPGKDGIYRNMPLGVFGAPSRNGMTYDIPSGLSSLRDIRGIFNVRLREGDLDGENGHPFLFGDLTKEEKVERAIRIDPKNTSHHIHAVRPVQCGNYYVIYGDISPIKPFGSCLVEKLEDPKRNCSFSLRCITRKLGGNPFLREVRMMVTFDHEVGPGFEVTCKRFQLADVGQAEISTESFSVDVDDILRAKNRNDFLSQEGITDQQLLDIFQTSKIYVDTTVFAMFDARTGVLIGENDVLPHSASHNLMRNI